MKKVVTSLRNVHTGSYLLHIYRQADGKNALLVGTLERLGEGGKHAFSSPGELLRLLGADDSDPAGRDQR